MKKIIISLGIIGVVGAAVIGGTIAYFNDTETSTGNIFTAGSINLKVDHLKQTYNGVDCETCSVKVYSSTATKVVAASAGASNQGPFPVQAVDVTTPHPVWLDETTLVPAQWIWATDPTTVADTTNGAEYTFQNKFQWNGTAVSVDLDLALASDNGYKIMLNGVTIVDKLLTDVNFISAATLTVAEETSFKTAMVNGQNTLEIIVRNAPLAANPVTGNPAGLLFNLHIERDSAECAEDSAFQQACVLWQEQDLDGSQQFFNFGDVKPGDHGTNLISLHVDDNDAYACLIPHDLDDQENGIVDPEVAAGDLPNHGNDYDYGELSDELEFFLWEDDGDGAYQNPEPILAGPGTTLDQIQTEIVAMQLTGGGPTMYVGLAWCAGTQTVVDDVVSCDGAGMGDIAQTDSLLASLTAYAEQQRNNPEFDCEDVVLE